MNQWTFGIITAGNPGGIHRILESIAAQPGLVHQEVIVGGDHLTHPKCPDIFHVPFDETEKKKGWITRKKNLITKYARFENICYLHDYVALEPGWFDGFNEFGYDWLTTTNKIINLDGRRFRDWAVIGNNAWMNPPIDDLRVPKEVGEGRLLDYNSRKHMRWFYYSGAYMCAKRHVMEAVPFNESRCWSEGEDVELCRRLYEKYGDKIFNINLHSTVKLLKQKPRAPWELLKILS